MVFENPVPESRDREKDQVKVHKAGLENWREKNWTKQNRKWRNWSVEKQWLVLVGRRGVVGIEWWTRGIIRSDSFSLAKNWFWKVGRWGRIKRGYWLGKERKNGETSFQWNQLRDFKVCFRLDRGNFWHDILC